MKKYLRSGSAATRADLFRWACRFLFANGIFLVFVSYKYFQAMKTPRGLAEILFLAFSYPTHFVSLAFIPLPVIGICLLAFPSRTFVFLFSVFLEFCLFLVVIVDSVVFSLYRFHLNGMVWNLLTGGAAGDMLPISWLTWAVFASMLLGILLVQAGLAHWTWKRIESGRARHGAAMVSIVLLAGVLGHGIHAWADATNRTRITNQVQFLPAFKPLTMKRFLRKHGFAAETQAASMSLRGDQSTLKYPLEPIVCRKGAGRYNLLVIVIDGWRFDGLNPELTPNLWKFSRDSWIFENHYSSGNATRFGIFGLFYGVFGTYWHVFLAEQQSPVLMRELLNQGYRMGIFASAPLVNPEFDRTVFADIRTKIALRQEGDRASERDREITDRMSGFLAAPSGGAPFFAFLFYDSSHQYDYPDNVAPFQPALKTVNHLSLNNDFDRTPYYNKYRNSVFYTDILVGRVLAEVERKGLLDNTVVLITSDHGEEFNDLKKNFWGHNGNYSRYQAQVPLVVRWPGERGRTFRHLTSHLDIPPTLMERMLGCTTDFRKYSNGRSLLDNAARPYVMIGNWGWFGTVEPGRISMALPSGAIEIVDPEYRELEGARMNPAVASDVLEGMSRFLTR